MLIYTYVSTLSTAFGKSKPAWVYFSSNATKSTINEKQHSIYINAGGAGQRCLGDLLRQELAWTLEQVWSLWSLFIIWVLEQIWCKATRSNTSKVTCMVVHVISVSTFTILHDRMLQQLRNHPTSQLAPLWVNNNRRFLSQCISTLWFPSHGSQQQSQRPRSTMNSDQISTAAQIGEEGRGGGEEQKESLRSFTNKGFTPDTPFWTSFFNLSILQLWK